MKQAQEQHLARLKTTIAANVEAKYRKGAKEHDNNLLDLSELDICDEAIQECTDQMVFLLTLREKLAAREGKQTVC